ncbi:hypothetical protein PIB30_057891 [Stylosanthes scabra]|uniref:Uncharacterized protein n=1 Tax=Stylosanthes scabra TaxID=79078 RepID=A0ABU6VMX9_9FABA|nr:hypothetical protein [Stylosanthes scabra]
MNVFMEYYKWYAPYSAKHLMRKSSFGGRSGGVLEITRVSGDAEGQQGQPRVQH